MGPRKQLVRASEAIERALGAAETERVSQAAGEPQRQNWQIVTLAIALVHRSASLPTVAFLLNMLD